MIYHLNCNGQTWHFQFSSRNWKRICLDLVTVETAVHGDFFVFHVLYKYSMYICMYNHVVLVDGTSDLFGWEGNHRSGIALSMHDAFEIGLITNRLEACKREMNTLPTLYWNMHPLPLLHVHFNLLMNFYFLLMVMPTCSCCDVPYCFTVQCFASTEYAVIMCLCVVCVCASVCVSVTHRYCIIIDKLRIMETSPHDSPATLVFWCKRSPKIQMSSPKQGRQMQLG